jgi:hypothetical protein
MPLVWLGALLVFSGVVFTAVQAIWRGRLSGRRSRAATVASNTLEPRKPGAGLGLGTNLPGLALVALGALLLLAAAVVQNPN